MPWFIWVVIALYVVSSLTTVAYIGKPRTPLTPGAVVFILIVNALTVWAIVEGVNG